MLSSSDGVWSAALVSDLDVSADVVEASVDVDVEGARVRLELDDGSGDYSSYRQRFPRAAAAGRAAGADAWLRDVGRERDQFDARVRVLGRVKSRLLSGAQPRLVLRVP